MTVVDTKTLEIKSFDLKVFGDGRDCFTENFKKSHFDRFGMVNDQFGAPISARSIAKEILELVSALGVCCIYYLQSESRVSGYDFTNLIFSKAKRLQLLDAMSVVLPLSSENYLTPVGRSKSS